MLEGKGIKQYKARIVDPGFISSGQGLELCWRDAMGMETREGYTFADHPRSQGPDCRVVAERSFLKIVRFRPFTDPRIQSGSDAGIQPRDFRAILPIVTRLAR